MAIALTPRGKRVWAYRIRAMVSVLVTFSVVAIFSAIIGAVVYAAMTGNYIEFTWQSPLAIRFH